MSEAMHWSDVMPAVNLGTEGAVPYRSNGELSVTIPAQPGSAAAAEGGKVEQPDLSHPRGFGFALGWLAQALEQLGELSEEDRRYAPEFVGRHIGGQGSLLMRHLLGESTDADRLALARACLEALRADAGADTR